MIKKSCGIFLFCLPVSGSFAQRMSIDNTYEITLRNAGAIKNADEVKGYFFFYVSDKVNKKYNKYTLKITDEKLKKLKDIEFEDAKDVTILNSAFNGVDLLFKFSYLKEQKIGYKVYGADGNLKYTYQHETNEPEGIRAIFKKAEDETANELKKDMFGELHPVESQGFITKNIENGGSSFTIRYYSALSEKEWSYTPKGGKFMGGFYLGTVQQTVYLHVVKFSGAFDRNPDSELVGIDMTTGKVKFEKSTYSAAVKLFPSGAAIASGAKKIIFGEYFSATANIIKDKSAGFVFWEVDDNGNFTNEKQLPWGQVFGKSMGISSGGKIDDFGYLFIHNALQTDDGDFFLIGEGYKTSGAKTHTTDLMLIQFDRNFSLKEVKIYPKQSNPVSLDGGGAFMSNQAKGYAIKFDDKFDYAYTSLNDDHSSFSVCYTDYEKGKKSKGVTFNSISYHEGKITTDKITTKSEADFSALLPAKQGQVLVLEYFRKEKRLDVHFEKLN